MCKCLKLNNIVRGNFIDLTAKPYLVDNHSADGKLIEDADKVLGNNLK